MTGSDSLPPRIKAIVEEELRTHPRRVVRMVDYLVVDVDLYDPARVPAGREGAVELARGVRIERLQGDLAERLFRATTLAGENWSPPGVPEAVHAFVADALLDGELVATDPGRMWDAERLWPAVQLSRLVRDNAISAEHAARREIFADGSERIVPFGGYENFTVYRLYPDRPGWLDNAEAAQLGTLLKAFWGGPELPLRVRRALRRVEAVVSERYLEDALPVVVGAFESLLQIGPTPPPLSSPNASRPSPLKLA